MGEIAVPSSMSAWCEGLWDFGKLDNKATGNLAELQLHATITKASSVAGLGFHLSAYGLGSGGYVLNDYKPENALAKSYYYPGALKSGQCYIYVGAQNWGPNVATITGMAVYQQLVDDGWSYFLTKFPDYKKPVEAPKLTAINFPKLGS